MAFLQFPNQAYFRLFQLGDTEIKGGTFQIASGLELKHIMLTIYIKGTLGGSERMRFKIYGNYTSTTAIYTSSWAALSGIGSAGNWLGNIYFDFESGSRSLNPNLTYYMSVEIENYTRSGDTFYIGCNLDWYSEVNTYLSAYTRGFRIRILGEAAL